MKLQFDATTVPISERKDFEELPPGNYLAEITGSEVKTNKSGNGEHLSLTFTVLGGPHANRKIWWNINTTHANPEAERIGREQLAKLVIACGLHVVSDSDEMHGRPVMLRLGVSRGRNGYPDRVEVKDVSAAPQQAAPAFIRPAAAAPAAPRGARPW
jgi:hypothetical protein